MSQINISIKHNRTLADARTLLDSTVKEVQSKFGGFVQRFEWSDDKSSVRMFGSGINVTMWVDAQSVHLTGDIAILGGLLGGPVATKLKNLIQQNVEKRLTGK